MKKFFHRFSTVDKGGVEALTRPRNDDLMAEKMQLHDSPPMTKDSKATSGDRVKALAARFETLSGSDQKLYRSNGLPTLTPRTSSHRKANAIEVIDSEDQSSPSPPPLPPPKDNSSPQRNASPLQMQRTSPSSSDDLKPKLGAGTERIHPSSPNGQRSVSPVAASRTAGSLFRSSKGSQDDSAAVGSTSKNGPTVQQIISKTVAFAPSPKKPSRPSSPPPSMPGSEDLPGIGGNIGNFAKATLASTARSRSTTKQQAGVVVEEATPSVPTTPRSNPATPQPISRPSSSLSTSRPQPRRSSSTTAAGRRGSGPIKGAESSASHALQPHSMASSLGFSQGRESVTNSIPFVCSANIPHLRSASPQSVATSSSRPAGYISASNPGSRPGSWTGRVNSNGSASQVWASNGAKSIVAPSWSEMTQEDLVSNLGARERTRQEVLWEIVASEERYVKELERMKEYYLDALLPADQDPSPSSPRSPLRSASDTNKVEKGAGYAGIDYLGMDAAAFSKEADVSAEVSSPKSIKASKPANPKRWSNGRLAGQSNGGASSQTGYAGAEGLGLSVPLPTSLRITLEAISHGLLHGHTLLSEALKQRYEEQWPLVRSLADIFARHADVLQHYKDYVMHLERALECLEEAALMERAMRGKRIKKDKLTVMVGLGRAVASLEAVAIERGECNLAIFLAMPFQRLLKYPLLFQNLLFHTDASTYEFESTVKMVVDVEKMVRSMEDEKINKEERDKVLDGFARIEGIKDKALLKPKRDRILVEERALYEENPRRAISESNDGNSEAAAPDGEQSGNAGLTSHNATAISSSGTLRAALKSKRSYRRLSDFLTVDDRSNQSTKAPNMGSKKDLWVVRFSDVELKCQRVGVTALPMVSSVVLQYSQREEEDHLERPEQEAIMTEEELKIREDFKKSKESKERMKALRNTTLRSKTRNLYKFVSVTSWKQVQKDKAAGGEGGLDGLATPQEIDEDGQLGEGAGEEDEDDGMNSNSSQETDIGVLDTERYVRQSKLSFSYWGHDKVEPRPIAITRTQSQHGSSVAAFRSRDAFPHLTKRHSLTPPSAAVISSPALSTKVVASNSHAKGKVDKFANRLRQTQDFIATSKGQRVNSPSRSAGASKTSVVDSVSASAQQGADSPIFTKSAEATTQQSRANLPQDPSIDSNLRLISSLINTAEESSSSKPRLRE